MDDFGWIDAATRLPEKADADVTGCVVAWHRYNGTMVIGWWQVKGNRFLTHWQRCPAAPMDYPQEYRLKWMEENQVGDPLESLPEPTPEQLADEEDKK